jgi:hypothetical protein
VGARHKAGHGGPTVAAGQISGKLFLLASIML